MRTIKEHGGLTSPTIEANWRMVNKLIRDSDMPDETTTPQPNVTVPTTPKPKNVCTIHIMFPVEGVADAAQVAASIQEITKDLPDVINDFRVSDARIAPRRMQPNG